METKRTESHSQHPSRRPSQGPRSQRPHSARPSHRPLSAPPPKVTVVEAGTGFKGSFDSNCPIVVKGKIEGDVNAPKLTVHPDGMVHGKVKVTELRSDGELEGEFDAEMVRLSGSVRNNTTIRADALEVLLSDKSPTAFGACDLEVGEMPSKDAVVKLHTEPKPSSPPAQSAPPPSSVRPSGVPTSSEAPASQPPAEAAASAANGSSTPATSEVPAAETAASQDATDGEAPFKEAAPEASASNAESTELPDEADSEEVSTSAASSRGRRRRSKKKR